LISVSYYISNADLRFVFKSKFRVKNFELKKSDYSKNFFYLTLQNELNKKLIFSENLKILELQLGIYLNF